MTLDRIPPGVWQRKLDLPGVDFNPDGQLAFLTQLARYAPECDWPDRADPHDTTHYHGLNTSFGFSSACLLQHAQ